MKRIISLILLFSLLLLGCASEEIKHEYIDLDSPHLKTAYFAGGCFWCVESAYEKYDGVVEVISGYMGGDEPNPTYKQVSAGQTSHAEAVKVIYDPRIISYADLVEIYWRTADPTDAGGSFVDRGQQYRSIIFYQTESEKELIENSMNKVQSVFDKPIVTSVEPVKEFYEAEQYHQDYYKVNPVRYNYYTSNSGRQEYRDSVWGDDQDYKIVTDLQHYVTREDGTETPFDNEYWNNTEEGIYVDIYTGEALFSSKDKYKSGTGWPSFTKPINQDAVIEKSDFKLLIPRTEIRSSSSDAHLGHVFEDGPAPTGLRYCMNSAALKFIPKEQMVDMGYEEYLGDFE